MDQVKVEPEEYENPEDSVHNVDNDNDLVTNFIAENEVKVEIKEEIIHDVKIESQDVGTQGIQDTFLEDEKSQEQQKEVPADDTPLSGSCEEMRLDKTVEISAGNSCKCIVCNMLLFGNNIISHTCKNSKEGSVTCNFCCKSFTDSSKLVKHKLIHAGKAHLNFDVSKKISETSNAKDTCKDNIKGTNSCLTCGKTFHGKNSLYNHMLKHSGDKRFNCNVCSKSFNFRSYLVEHMRIHTGERPFECEICNKKFCYKSNLNFHLKIHTGEKSCACNICGKLFSRRCNLIYHLRRHNGERPYTCEFCSKSFSESSKLVIHTRTHTGEKPFSCVYCSKTFSDKSPLIRHIRVHSGEKPFKCTVCDLSYADYSTVKRHERRHILKQDS